MERRRAARLAWVGCGLVNPATMPRGTGLQNMADRLSLFGGRIDAESVPAGGTTVRGRIPVAELEVAR